VRSMVKINKSPRAVKPNRYTGRRTSPPERVGRPEIGRALTLLMSKAWRAGKMLFGGVFVLVLLGGLSIGLILGYQALIHSPYFMVRKVIVKGLDRVSQEEVLRRTGLDKPANLLALRLGRLSDSLEELPWIENVTITKKLSGAIIIEIKERRPVALISLGALYYLDENKRPFKKVEPQENPDLPIITGFTRADLVERERFFRRDLEEVFSLLAVLAERNDQFRLDNISEINFDSVRGLSLFTRRDNVQVKIGFGDYRTKFKRLGRVLAYLKANDQDRDLAYLNVECEPRVVVRAAEQS